jgi:hypothetical protein
MSPYKEKQKQNPKMDMKFFRSTEENSGKDINVNQFLGRVGINNFLQ